MPNSFLATTSVYHGAAELEEERKEAQQWLDKVRTLAEEQNFDIRKLKSVIIEDISSRAGYAIVNMLKAQVLAL